MKINYNLIRSILKIEYSKDYISTLTLSNLLSDIQEVYSPKKVQKAFVFGAGPSILAFFEKYNDKIITNKQTIIVSSDSATKILLKNELFPDIIVTDLDGISLKDVFQLTIRKKEVIMYIHAHGDNKEKITSIVPVLKQQKNVKLVGTTQTKTIFPVINIGGFTDGDRALLITLLHKPKEVYLIGMDFTLQPLTYNTNEKKDPFFQQKKLYIGYLIFKETICENKKEVKFHNLSFTRFNC